jgi:UDP-glucuronate decarboxylase
VRSRRGKLAAVTGGAGFIGSHLCEALLAQGCKVVCIDRLPTAAAVNVVHLGASRQFSYLRHDITKPLPKNLPAFDEIYNFACPTASALDPAEQVDVAMACALGALNVLERASRDGAQVLQASTARIYGDAAAHPQSEACLGQVDPVGPRAGHDEGKRFAETLVSLCGASAGLPVKIARIFNTYGPRMEIDDDRVIASFLVQALSGRDLTIYGDGRQTRTFCYVDDLVEACLLLMAAPEDLAGPVNLGHPEEIAVADLAQTVLQLTGSRSRIVYRPPTAGAVRRRRPDLARAWRHLGWAPKVSLREGLERTIDSFVQRLNAMPEPARAASAWR